MRNKENARMGSVVVFFATPPTKIYSEALRFRRELSLRHVSRTSPCDSATTASHRAATDAPSPAESPPSSVGKPEPARFSSAAFRTRLMRRS